MKRRSPRRSRHTTSRGLRFESLETRRLLAADCLHNLPYPEDVNGDTHASPLDALAVINQLISPGEALGEGESAAGLYLDVNNDLNVTAADALNVVNHLNAQSASSHSSSDSDDNDDSGDESEDDEPQDVELKAHLTGVGSEYGEAEYEIEDEHGAVKQEFEAEVEDAEPGTTHEVLVDGVVVGQLTIDSKGNGKLKLSSDPEDDELPLPDDFLPIGDNSRIVVGDILEGTLMRR